MKYSWNMVTQTFEKFGVGAVWCVREWEIITKAYVYVRRSITFNFALWMFYFAVTNVPMSREKVTCVYVT